MTVSTSATLRRAGPVGLLALTLGVWSWPSSSDAQTQERRHSLNVFEGFELRAGVLQSDNVLRVRDPDGTDTIYTAGFGVNLDQVRNRFNFRALGDLELQSYPSDTFGTDLAGYLDSSAGYFLVPQLLEWRVQDTYGQQAIDPFASPTPDTLEGVNYFSTGPRLTLRVASNVDMAFDASYSLTTHEDTNLENQRYGGGIALIRRLSDRRSISLNAMTERVNFDEESLNADYDERQVLVNYTAEVQRTTVRADLGYSSLDRRTNGRRNSSGMLARLELERRITSASTLGLYGQKQLADASDAFRTRIGQTGASTPPHLVATADPFEDRTFGGRWSLDKGRTFFEIGASHSQQEFEEGVENDRTMRTVYASFRRRIGPRLSLSLQAHRQKDRFTNAGFEARDVGGAASLHRDFGRHLGAALQFVYYDRTSTNVADNYVERRAGLLLYFRPAGRGH